MEGGPIKDSSCGSRSSAAIRHQKNDQFIESGEISKMGWDSSGINVAEIITEDCFLEFKK